MEQLAIAGTAICGSKNILFENIRGQERVKRALEIAAAGMHNLLLIGPTGAGKTTLAGAIESILPDYWQEVGNGEVVTGFAPYRHAFRSPHNSVTLRQMTGEGKVLREGEIVKANGGALFLDELADYRKAVLESLIDPLREREDVRSDGKYLVRRPARFSLIATMRPCPCGYLQDKFKECICMPREVMRYARRVPEMLYNCFELIVAAGRIPYEQLLETQALETSAAVRDRVERVVELSKKRQPESSQNRNAEMGQGALRTFCRLDEQAADLLVKGMQAKQLEQFSFDKILRVARTIADLACSEAIRTVHVAEALQYQKRNPWAMGDG
jgi:magnesium chelatase family protein